MYLDPDSSLPNHGLDPLQPENRADLERRMAVEDALFGGEVTAHYYFRDFFYAASGIIPALFVLELLSKVG
jgi:phosphomannomutase